MRGTLLILHILCLFYSNQLVGHGALDEQIKEITSKIKRSPKNANLFLKRGQLYAQHEEFQPARKDYLHARNLDQSLSVTDFLMADLYLQNKQLDSALLYANTFLAQKPNHSNALITRAGIHQKLGESDSCKKDLERAMMNLKEPKPGHFIAIAEAVLLDDTTNLEEALSWLEKGQKEFGFDIVIQSKKIDLYLKASQYKQAVMTIDEAMRYFPRKEKWLFQKAQIYQKMKRGDMAITYYKATLTAIQQLPIKFQRQERILQLEVQTLESLATLTN